MRLSTALIMGLTAASCSPEQPAQKHDPIADMWTVTQPDQPARVKPMDGGGYFVTVKATTAKAAGTPELTLVCEGDGQPGLMLFVKVAPTTPPPLANVYLAYRFEDGVGGRQEISWAGNDTWMFRNDKQAESHFVARFLASKSVTITMPPQFADARVITWKRSDIPARNDLLRKWCFTRSPVSGEPVS